MTPHADLTFDGGGAPRHPNHAMPLKHHNTQMLLDIPVDDKFTDERKIEFFEAIQAGDLEKAKTFVMEEPRVINLQGIDAFSGMSPLHVVASKGLDRLAAMFLRQRVACHITQDGIGREPMHEAVLSGEISMVKTLYDGGAFTPDQCDVLGMSAMHYAAMLGSESSSDMIRFLVWQCKFHPEKGVSEALPYHENAFSVEKQDCMKLVQNIVTVGDTPLHIAVKAGSVHAVNVLLEIDSSVKVVNADGKTALHCVVEKATDDHDFHNDKSIYHKIFKMLLTKGAKVNAVDKDGRTVAHAAASANSVQTLAYLSLHTNANVRAKDSRGKTPLHVAVESGCTRCVDVIQSSHPETLDDLDFDGNSVLHAAVALDDYQEIVQVLVKFQGVDAEIRNHAGKTAVDVAEENGKMHLANILRQYSEAEQSKAMQRLDAPNTDGNEEHRTHECLKNMPQNADFAAEGHLPSVKDARNEFLEIARDQDLKLFVDQFASNDDGCMIKPSQYLHRVESLPDKVALIKLFLDRFASRANFDRVIAWRKTGRSDQPAKKKTMGYGDMLRLLEQQGLLDELVVQDEVYGLFVTKVHGQKKQTISKEVTYSGFRSFMHAIAKKGRPGQLEALLSQPETLTGADVFEPNSDCASSGEDDDLNDTSMHALDKIVDKSNYLPTVTGINSPTHSSSRPLSRQLSSTGRANQIAPARGTNLRGMSLSGSSSLNSSKENLSRHIAQSPDSLRDAFRDFGPSHQDKIRVDMDAGPDQTASWAPGLSMTHPSKKLRDFQGLGRVLPEQMRKRLPTAGSSRMGSGSQGSGLSIRKEPSAGFLSWKPTGCSRSHFVIDSLSKRGMSVDNYKSISNLSHFLKPIWVDFFPAVAPMPQLIDAAHEATYSMCFEKGDYVGCFEVIQSSLNHTPRDQFDLYQRMYAQAVIFCNAYALRCIRARNLAAAALLLQKSDHMTGPGVVSFPGRRALRGWTMDAHAQYYFQRNKTSAALQYMQRAMDQIAHMNTAEGRATWRGHFAAILFKCSRAAEALEILKEALSEIVGTKNGVISREDIAAGKIPHAQRHLAAALCFNLSVCHASLNHLEHALTCCRFALLLCHVDAHKANWTRMQKLHDALLDVLDTRAAMPTLPKTNVKSIPPRSDSTPPQM